MFSETRISQFRDHTTPFYFYDLDVLKQTLQQIDKHGIRKGYHVHFALKANHQPRILEEIRKAGLGADCVSGGEVQRALDCGFEPHQIAFAGVGKRDSEINLGLDHDIFCFNCESVQELQVINELAEAKDCTARVALRINPNVDAKTHKYITTGLDENKFGINEEDLPLIFELLPTLKHIDLIGIHFHIGSQIEELKPFRELCDRANSLNQVFSDKGIQLKVINVGGGYGINYADPDGNAIPDFEHFFGLFDEHLNLRDDQELHFELGRSVTGQCGSLITEVLYTKHGRQKNFAIIDAGMTELIRPALYQAKHSIQLLTPTSTETDTYDVVGPICESSDTFRTDLEFPKLERGNLLAIRSCGAYGEVMKSQYNLRQGIDSVFSVDLD